MSRDTTKPRPANWLVRFVLPAIVASGTTVTTVLALGQAGPITSEVQAPSSASISSIEFTSFAESHIVQTIQEACELTSCEESSLHPMIKSYADQMDADQLDAARWAQVRLLMRGMRSLEAAIHGSDAAAIAHLELTAAARIAKFYTTKISTLR